jgi:hypothetical protein
MKKLTMILFGIFFLNAFSQNINMEFPYFKGKSYDFIIFQGTGAKAIIKGTIPEDGKFILTIPNEYFPYNGMSRWLITGTAEGGGLDMLIPGHDFAVVCKEKKPNEQNILYIRNEAIPELNTLYSKQQKILAKYEAMRTAKKIFSTEDPHYRIFELKYQEQINLYESFQRELMSNDDYAARFINIVNITLGVGTKLLNAEKDNAENINEYITDQLDWSTLYTSGHWKGVINSWVSIHTKIFNDPKRFAVDFSKITGRIKNDKHYQDFVKRIAGQLRGKDEFTESIVPVVVISGKIRVYDDDLLRFVSGAQKQPAQAFDLIKTNRKVNNH